MKLSNANPIIRAATIDDLQKIAEIKIDNQSANDYVSEMDAVIHGLFMREYKKRWMQRLQNSVSTLVLSNDENMYGFISCSIYSEYLDEFVRMVEVTDLYVLPEMRRQQWGSMLCDALLNRLKEVGFKGVIIWVPECSVPLMNFCKKIGFKVANESREEIVHDQIVIREVKHQIDIKST